MYATAQDMIDRYGEPHLVQLTDVGRPQTGGIVMTVLEARLLDASAEIDGYLAGRMVTPLVSPPAILRLLCCRMAHGLLVGEAATENDVADVKDARAYLRDIANGKISLTLPSEAAALPGVGEVVFSAGQKVMGREFA